MDFTDLQRVPFVQGGRDPKIGLDCYGLCKEVYRRLGRTLPEYDSLGQEIPEYASVEGLDCIDKIVDRAKKSFLIPLDSIQPFALVVFAIKPPYESHVGIVLEDKRRFIHTIKNVGCCIERLDLSCWKNRIRGFYSWNQ